jgi:hypothetical protein
MRVTVGKRSRKAQRPRPLPYASSEPDIHSDATLGPDASLDSTVSRWLGPESTSAPEVGQADTEPVAFAKGSAELLDKFLHGWIPLPSQPVILILTIAWFAFTSWLYLQDNQAGRLGDAAGLSWFVVKAGLYSVLFLLVAVVIALVTRFKKE